MFDFSRDPFYFFSVEGHSPELPVQARLVRQLKAKNDREACLIQLAQKVRDYQTSLLVLVPKSAGKTFYRLSEEDPIFAYVLDGRPHERAEEIDLSPGNKLVIDLGGMTKNYEVAKTWQVSKG